MEPEPLKAGDTVIDSPAGRGYITDFSEAGHPSVKGIAVSWLVRSDGTVYDPKGVYARSRIVRITI